MGTGSSAAHYQSASSATPHQHLPSATCVGCSPPLWSIHTNPLKISRNFSYRRHCDVVKHRSLMSTLNHTYLWTSRNRDSSVSWGGVRLSPLGTPTTIGLLYQPRMIDDDEYGAVGGMRIGRGNRSPRRKPAPVPGCPPQVLHDLALVRNRAVAVGSRRLTA
jgi:hypothetical protein